MIKNIFSAFDGISVLQVAVNRTFIGSTLENYYASEIDSYATSITKRQFPNTISLGDIQKLGIDSFKHQIDLMVGGSPCQGFSFSGRQLNFKDPRSKLFFDYVRLLKELNPRYFILENVPMEKMSENVITDYLEVYPITIDSYRVSGQNRRRLYWTNIPNVVQPKNKNIFLKDILEKDAREPMYSNYGKGFGELKPRVHYGKSVTLRVGGDRPVVETVGQNQIPDKYYLSEKMKKYILDNKAGKNGQYKLNPEKSPTLTATMHKLHRAHTAPYIQGQFKPEGKTNIRKILPVEAERLQTLPDNYTAEGVVDGKLVQVSDGQRYKAIGNSFTADIIAHILRFTENNPEPLGKIKQMRLFS